MQWYNLSSAVQGSRLAEHEIWLLIEMIDYSGVTQMCLKHEKVLNTWSVSFVKVFFFLLLIWQSQMQRFNMQIIYREQRLDFLTNVALIWMWVNVKDYTVFCAPSRVQCWCIPCWNVTSLYEDYMFNIISFATKLSYCNLLLLKFNCDCSIHKHCFAYCHY